MATSGWCFLAAMIVAYGFANLLQSVAAARTTVHHSFHPGLLVRLAGHPTYLIGLGCQVAGFVLAFLARRDLPLFLVQASMAAGLGVTAVLGVLVLKWRLPTAEVALLGLLFGGITALVLAAQPAPSRQLGVAGVVGLAVALVVVAVLGFFAVRLHGAPGSVVLGSLAGLAFSAAAVAARPLASVPSAEAFLRDPLLYLLIAHSILGQLLLGLAMQRGSTTAAVAAMDAAGAVPAAIVGLLLLDDKIWPGREWLAGIGFLASLGAVVLLARYAEPQHHHRPAAAGTPRPAPLATPRRPLPAAEVVAGAPCSAQSGSRGPLLPAARQAAHASTGFRRPTTRS